MNKKNINFKYLINSILKYILISFFVFLFIFSISTNLFKKLFFLNFLKNSKKELSLSTPCFNKILLNESFKHKKKFIDYNKISPYLLISIISIENYKFKIYKKKRILRLIKILSQNNIALEKLTKNLFKIKKILILSNIIFKTKKLIINLKIKKIYKKKEIITIYLNIINFKNNFIGSNILYKKFINLNSKQIILYINLFQTTPKYNLYKYSKNILKKRKIILKKIYKYKFLKRKEYNLTLNHNINIKNKIKSYNIYIITYSKLLIQEFLLKWIKKKKYNLLKKKIKIHIKINNKIKKYTRKKNYNK